MRRVLQSLLIATALAVPAFAQADSDKEEPVKSYVMPYFIVGAGIALGLVAVCRASNRSKVVRAPD